MDRTAVESADPENDTSSPPSVVPLGVTVFEDASEIELVPTPLKASIWGAVRLSTTGVAVSVRPAKLLKVNGAKLIGNPVAVAVAVDVMDRTGSGNTVLIVTVEPVCACDTFHVVVGERFVAFTDASVDRDNVI